MDIGSLFLILALALAVGLFISRPFFKSSDRKSAFPEEAVEAREHDRSALMADEERVLDALQELDFDNTLGKVPAEEYQAQRGSLLKQGAEIMRNLDQLDERNEVKTAEDRVEKMIAARRIGAKAQTSPANIGAGDAIEDQIAARRRSRDEKSVGFCPKCGHPLQKSDKFCPKCGISL